MRRALNMYLDELTDLKEKCLSTIGAEEDASGPDDPRLAVTQQLLGTVLDTTQMGPLGAEYNCTMCGRLLGV